MKLHSHFGIYVNHFTHTQKEKQKRGTVS